MYFTVDVTTTVCRRRGRERMTKTQGKGGKKKETLVPKRWMNGWMELW